MNKSEFKKMFSEFCNSEIRKGKCEECDCAFCVVNSAYERIFTDYTDKVVLAVKNALCEYDSSNVDVVLNEETEMLDIVYHSRHNSFGIAYDIAHCDEVDFNRLEIELNELDVGYVW